MKTKKESQTIHTKRRMVERYGVMMTQRVLYAILHEIENGRGMLLMKQSLRVSVFDVTVNVREQEVVGVGAKAGPLTVRVVYDKNRKNIATVLRLDMDPRRLHPDDYAA